MSSTLVSQLNSSAISFMQRGEFDQATCTLKRALSLLKSSLQPSEEERSSRSCIVDSVGDKSLQSSVFYTGQAKTTSEASSASFELFSSAFDLPDECLCAANKTQASLVILYNMALSYHLAGLASGSSRGLRLARDLYKMALSIVEGCLGDALTDPLLLLQLLALFNNMGHIHASCFEPEQTKQCILATNALLESRTFHVSKNGEGAELFRFFEWNSTLRSSEPLFGFAPAA